MNNKKRALSIVGSSDRRNSMDFYATPDYVTLALLEREEFGDRILEPACGDGAISKLLKGTITSMDVIDRGCGTVQDYFTYIPEESFDAVITNPPYSLALRFVEKALSDVKEYGKVAMLLKLVFLEGEERRKFFQKSPPKKVLVFSKRLVFSGQTNTSMLCFAWFIWEKGFKGKTTIEWVETLRTPHTPKDVGIRAGDIL